MDPKEMHQRASVAFDARVQAVGDDQWDNETPCDQWDVRDLVNHLVGEQLWAVELLEGRTIGDVGDALEGDLLGDDPVGAWDRAAVAAGHAAMAADLDATAHLSYGDVPVAAYLRELAGDLTIHAWDLARAVGADEELDHDLVEPIYEAGVQHQEAIRASGLFGDRVEVPDDAPVQTKMLALFGRNDDQPRERE